MVTKAAGARISTIRRLWVALLFGWLANNAVLAEVLLVTNGTGDSVFAYETSTATSLGAFVPSGSGGLNDPRGIAYGPDGNLYVVSSVPSIINRYDPRTGAFIDTFATASGLGPFAIKFGPDGNLYLTAIVANSVVRYNGATGAFMDFFVASGAGGIVRPRDLVFGPDGNLYVSSPHELTDPTTGEVLRYDGTTGAFLGAFATGVDARGLVFGPDGDLYVADFLGDRVLKYNGTTGALIGTFASGGGLDGPVGVLFGPDGDLYVAGFGAGDTILRFDGSTGAFEATIAAGNGLIDPRLMIFARVPEPTTLSLFALGLVAVVLARRREKK